MFIKVIIVSALVAVSQYYVHGLRGRLLDGCDVANLTISTPTGLILSNDWRCNKTINSTDLLNMPDVNFTNVPISRYLGKTFLLAEVDLTSNQLLWMVANITAREKYLAGSRAYYDKSQIILKGYTPPVFNASTLNKNIAFYVFEENNPSIYKSKAFVPAAQQFNLTRWLNIVNDQGLMLSGPVAGSNLVAHFSYVQPYAPAGYPPAYPPAYPPIPAGNPSYANPGYPQVNPTYSYPGHSPPAYKPYKKSSASVGGELNCALILSGIILALVYSV